MNITIVAPYCPFPLEPHFNHFWYLVELLPQSYNVLLITSNFKHYNKSFRWPQDAETTSGGRLKVMLLEESGCGKDVSLDRVRNHHVFVKSFEQWLNNCRLGGQDVVFSVYLLIATNLLLGKHKMHLDYKLIIDMQDVQPESFSSVMPFLKRILRSLLPFFSHANRAYRYADALVAVLQTYLDRAKRTNPNVPNEVVYTGTGSPKLDAAPTEDFGDDKTCSFYLGIPSYSYDVETMCKSIHRLLGGGENVELHIMGGGPDSDRFKQYTYEGIKFYGYVPYAEMVSVARGCDISVNAIYSHAMQSIINRLSDHMTLQKPILDSQVNDEVAEVLILLPHADYRSDDVGSFVQAAKDILAHKSNPVQSDEIIRHFKRDVAYQKVVNLIERLIHE